jgi:ankyrin repeat protein
MSEEVHEILKADNVDALEDRYYATLESDEILEPYDKADHPVLFQAGPPLISGAAYYRSYKCLRFLISQSADMQRRDLKGRQPILFGVAGGSLPIVQLLIEAGCHLGSTDFEGNGVMHYTVLFQRKALLLWCAYTNAAPVSSRNLRRVTPLHMAATEELTEYMKILCDNGADVNAKTDVSNLLIEFDFLLMGRLRFTMQLLNRLSEILHF